MGNINRDILKLAVPSILANVTVPLVGLVDMAGISGHPVRLKRHLSSEALQSGQCSLT